METTTPWKIRNLAVEEDLPRLLTLYDLIEDHDQAGNRMDEATLRQQLARPGHDPAQDRWVACLPESGELIGYSLALPLGEIALVYTAVHPEWRRRKLGTLLLGEASARARASGAKAVMLYANDKQTAAPGFLAQHGFTFVGQYTEMRAPLDGEFPQPKWPLGLRVRSYREVQDISLLTEAMNLAYAGQPGHNHADVEQMSSWLAEWNQDGMLLLFAPGGGLAGISRVEPSAERTQANGIPTGYIDAPGLYPAYRQMKLYRTFLRTGMHWLKAQGMQQVELESWGDTPEVLAMYARAGFSTLRTITTYLCRFN